MLDGVIIETVARIIKTFHIHLYFSMKKKPPAVVLDLRCLRLSISGGNSVTQLFKYAIYSGFCKC